MTAVLCYSTDFLSLIITDKRVSFGRYGQAGYSDNYEKLVNLPEMGWAAGAGAADYLDELKAKLATTDILSVGDIINVYEEVSTSYSNHTYSEEDIMRSAVVASWLGYDEQINFLKFHIGVLSPEHIGKDGIGSVGRNQIYTLYPIDYIEDEDRIIGLLNKYGCEHQFDGNLNSLYEKLFLIFEEIAHNSNYVSSTCDIGLHIYLDNSVYKINFSGEISELLQEVRDNRIHQRYTLVSRIN